MMHIGAFEAKNRFSEILRWVAEGEEVTITRHGKIVAVITDPQRGVAQKASQAFGQWEALAGSLKATPDEISAWVKDHRP
ncbi:MAG: type II toxin-antitoxin system Phd/YefM family antitoxin [Alphaproteobacteria bacterium]